MRDKAKSILNELSFKDAFLGAVVGLLISAAIQPFAIAAFTDMYVSMGAPGHTPPPLDVEVSKMENSFSEGERLEEYENLVWNDSYERYRVTIENTGGKAAYDIETRVPLPGCIVGISQDTAFSETEVILTNQLAGRLNGNLSEAEYDCSKIINANQLFPGERIVVDFVIKDEFSDCDVLIGFHHGAETITEYQWRKSTQIYSEVAYQRSADLEPEFEEFRKDNPGVLLEAAEPHGRTYSVLIPYNVSSVSSPREVLNECHITLPEGNSGDK